MNAIASRETTRQESVASEDRGRSANKPSERGWKDILSRTKEEMKKDNLSIVAAGVAFYTFFGLIPALAALVAIYGLVADPATIKQQIDAMKGVLPAEVMQILGQQMTRMAQSASGLSWGAALGILLALWSGAKATKALITALNITYDEEETRGFFRLNLTALALTLAGVIGAIVAIGLIVAIPIALNFIHLSGGAQVIVQILRWPLLAVFAMCGLAMIYRFAPDRDPERWRWVTWGAGIVTVLWVAASAGFSFYVSNFGSYNKTYGSLGAVAVLMLWFLLSSYIILLGAELDAEMEHHTTRDTTKGPAEPGGKRNAFAADHVGKSAESED